MSVFICTLSGMSLLIDTDNKIGMINWYWYERLFEHKNKDKLNLITTQRVSH